jgi:hypothetical protein
MDGIIREIYGRYSLIKYMRLDKKAVLSFFVFVVVFLKDILVSGFTIIPERGSLNGIISYLFILPMSLIGLLLSINVIWDGFKSKRENNIHFFNKNVMLALPLLVYVLFFIILEIVAIIYHMALR